MRNDKKAKTIRSATAVMTAALLAASLVSGSASAQIGGSGLSPLGMTSPLGIGPSSPVAPTGIPLGATELASPGVSPMTSGVSPLGPATGTTNCSGSGSILPQALSGMGNPMTASSGMSGSSTVFDGGGMGTASGTCAGTTGSAAAAPAASASSPTGMGSASAVGRVGIPLGSTELGTGGLSPPPDVLTPNPSVPLSSQAVPCPLTGMSPTTGMSSGFC